MYLIELEKEYSYDEILNSCIRLHNGFTPLISVNSIGLSHDNREIILVSIGFGSKTIVCSGGVHARETVNPVVLLKIIEQYADSYDRYKCINGMNVRELLQEYSIVFVPLLNPDGYMTALHGYDAIQNETLRNRCLAKEIPHKEWKYNARAIDLNRNFSSRLFQASYEMPQSMSENETKALARVFHQYDPLAYLDFHSRGESIFYHRSLMSKEYNENQLRIAKSLQNSCGYTLENPTDEVSSGDSGGNTVHYYSEFFTRPALTIETVKDEEGFPLNPVLQEEVFSQIHALPLTLLTIL